MTRILILAVGVLFVATGLAMWTRAPQQVEPLQKPSPPPKYTVKEHRFAVQFPPGAEVNPLTQDLPKGGKVYNYMALTGGTLYAVATLPAPEGKSLTPSRDLLRHFLESGFRRSGGKPIQTRESFHGLNKLPALDSTALQEGQTFRARSVMDSDRVFTVSVTGTDEATKSQTAEAFIESFEVLSPNQEPK